MKEVAHPTESQELSTLVKGVWGIPLWLSGRLRGHEGQELRERSQARAESDPSRVSEGTCSHVASRAFSF